MKVLISGFEVFADFDKNPSEQTVKALQKQSFPFDLKGVILPVSFEEAFLTLKEHIDRFQPDYVIGLGLAAQRSEITIERIAINLMEARIPDNNGLQPIGEKIDPTKEDGVFSNLPIKTMLLQCQKSGVKSSVSNTAGTYVCNYLMYKIISYGKEAGYKGGFIHLPPTPETKPAGATVSLNTIVEGLAAMLKALNSTQEDITLNTGAES